MQELQIPKYETMTNDKSDSMKETTCFQEVGSCYSVIGFRICFDTGASPPQADEKFEEQFRNSTCPPMPATSVLAMNRFGDNNGASFRFSRTSYGRWGFDAWLSRGFHSDSKDTASSTAGEERFSIHFCTLTEKTVNSLTNLQGEMYGFSTAPGHFPGPIPFGYNLFLSLASNGHGAAQ